MHILLKFGTKENIEKLQKGKIRFGTRLSYNEAAASGNENIGDKYEGVFVIKNCDLALCHPETGVVLAKGTCNLKQSDERLDHIPFFCSTYISDKNIKLIDGKYKIIFDDDFKECFMKEADWEYVLAVDTSKFIERIKLAFKDINVIARPIKYECYENLTVERNNDISENIKNVLLWKDSKYIAQKEFRIILEDKDIGEDKFFDGNIGDISDISHISRREEWLSPDADIEVIINK